MPVQPLTHHEILKVVEPFTRAGRHVDLPASNRFLRRLLFKPVEHAGDAADAPGLHEVLELEIPGPDRYRLTRVTRLAGGGPEARLVTEGPAPAELLARIDAVPLLRPFCIGRGYIIVQSHRLEPAGELILTEATVLVGGLTLQLEAAVVKGMPAEVRLRARPGDPIELPPDLLAVLGWEWSRLTRPGDEWKCTVQVRGKEPDKSRLAEARIEAAAKHLALTLGEPPRRFHERLTSARWGVFFRRSIPMLVCIALLAGSAATPYLNLPTHSVIRMLIFNAPPILLMLIFCLRELPRLEFPPIPRASGAAAWRTPEAVARGASQAQDVGQG